MISEELNRFFVQQQMDETARLAAQAKAERQEKQRVTRELDAMDLATRMAQREARAAAARLKAAAQPKRAAVTTELGRHITAWGTLIAGNIGG